MPEVRAAVRLRSTLALVLLLLAGCARLGIERYDPRLVPDLTGRVLDARSGGPLVARLHFEDDSNAIVVSSAAGTFHFPQVRRTVSDLVGADHRQARWLVAEAPGHRPVRVKVDPEPAGELLIRLDPAP